MKRIDDKTVYNDDLNTLDYRKAAASELKSFRRVNMPDPVEEKEELKIQILKNKLENTIKEYQIQHCDTKGNILNDKSNSEEDKAATKRLKDKVENEKLVIGSTDKTGLYYVTSTDNFEKEGLKHIGKDDIIGLDEVKQIEAEMNSTVRVWKKSVQYVENRET